MAKISSCELLQFPRFLDCRGNLSFIQNYDQIPFEIKRTYWIYDIPGGEARDGHAYYRSQEVIIALSGSFDVLVDDGVEQRKYSLNRSSEGLYIPSGIWRTIDNFSTNAFQLVLCSTHFDERDYMRDYDEFIKLRKSL